MDKEQYINLIKEELLPFIHLDSKSPFDPITVNNRSTIWHTVAAGNYAAVFVHDEQPDWVVKVYGRNQEELLKEVDVYKKIGDYHAYSRLISYGENFLVLKKLQGITLFDALVKGIPIHDSVIKDIDLALEYARSVGLNPYDVHGKNVAMEKGRGYIVDISDFYKKGYCPKWNDLKKAYFKIYRPFLLKYHPPIPFFIVDGIRKGYRKYRKWIKPKKS